MGPKYYKKKSCDVGSAIYLVIVESPSKCTKIESYLGQNYKCIASRGHIRELGSLKNIDIKNNFTPTFTIIKDKLEHVQEMRTIIGQFRKENIIIATDDDREGEAIGWHICDVFHLPIQTTKRILFHEITKPAISEAIKNPTTLHMDLVHAQHTRQILDILVGFKVSPHLWKHIFSSKKNALSAGRCQTPALRLIYDNEKERNSRDVERKYKVHGYFTSKNIDCVLNHEFVQESELIIFMEKSKTFEHMMHLGHEKASLKSPPKPFNTSKLLQTASSQLHTSPKQTMQLCQTLYQNGYITYMRTDSTKYAPPFLDTAREYVVESYGESYVGNHSLIINESKENPHEAIRVTNLKRSHIQSDNSREKAMYNLIWKNTLESCMADAKYNVLPISISAPSINVENKLKKVSYQHNVEIPLFLGWKMVTTKDMGFLQNEMIGMKMFLNTLLDKPVVYSQIKSDLIVQNNVSHYSEASLIRKLEDLGIGRPSTFAMLVETIQERGYVKCQDIVGKKERCWEYSLSMGGILDKVQMEKTFGNEKSKLQIQHLGVLCIEFLIEHFNTLFNYEYTKEMETQLDEITEHKGELSAMCNKCFMTITELSKNVSKIEKEKHILDEHHEVVFTQYGPAVKQTFPNNEQTIYHNLKERDIDMQKLRDNAYSIDELLEKTQGLGTYKGQPIYIKEGKYGPYLQHGESKTSIKEWKKKLDTITLDIAIDLLQTKKEEKDTKSSILHTLTPNMQIRRGKFGPYIFYKTKSMKQPKFYNMKKCPYDYTTCSDEDMISWINTTYLENSSV